MTNKAILQMVPLRKAIELTGLSGNTLRKYADNGSIKSIRTPSGQRLFDIDGFIQRGGISAVVCYCRVSSRKQRDDLARQVERMQERYPQAEIIKDIGSGLNFKRKGLQTLLERLLRGDKLNVVVAHRDRLARFGFDLIEFLVEKNGGELLVLDPTVASAEAELTADLLALLHHFSCRRQGMGSNIGKENKALSECHAKETLQKLVRCVASSVQPDGGAPESAEGEPTKTLDGRGEDTYG
jgi:predicted site-specific integrase-resolvase